MKDALPSGHTIGDPEELVSRETSSHFLSFFKDCNRSDKARKVTKERWLVKNVCCRESLPGAMKEQWGLKDGRHSNALKERGAHRHKSFPFFYKTIREIILIGRRFQCFLINGLLVDQNVRLFPPFDRCCTCGHCSSARRSHVGGRRRHFFTLVAHT